MESSPLALICFLARGSAGCLMRPAALTRRRDWVIPWWVAAMVCVEVIPVVLIVVAVAVVLILVDVGAAGAALLAVASEAEKEGLLDD